MIRKFFAWGFSILFVWFIIQLAWDQDMWSAFLAFGTGILAWLTIYDAVGRNEHR